ncbi:uncharacterized protein METZ01_LOCUS182947 [marine metagenome]|uniref:Uncharacterized protein n=1 Tax=marine metagenome TaxID=408172 RepID=A0A382CXP4_9ZZZZ
MLVARISVNWTVKPGNSKDLPKYGNSNEGRINPKYLDGINGIHGKLEAQGHTIVEQGKQFFLWDLQGKAVIQKFK